MPITSLEMITNTFQLCQPGKLRSWMQSAKPELRGYSSSMPWYSLLRLLQVSACWSGAKQAFQRRQSLTSSVWQSWSLHSWGLWSEHLSRAFSQSGNRTISAVQIGRTIRSGAI